jgi:methylenetetrahydrofolate reductase (NADPH)
MPMSYPTQKAAVQARPFAALLQRYSVEVTSHDAAALDFIAGNLPAGAEAFIANLPAEGTDTLVRAAARLRRAGLEPVPHIVARKLRDAAELDDCLARLAGEAGVERVLALGGDRDRPEGAFEASLQLIESDLFGRHGIGHVSIACYPEGHPRIPQPELSKALVAKLAAAARRGLQARLVSQFAFQSEPILSFVRDLRAAGVAVPFRVGVAGPAKRTTLMKYAMRCGVGASLRALTERRHLVSGLLGGETPEELLRDIAQAFEAEPSLGIEGVHFFTFGAPGRSIEWAAGQTA